MRRIILSALIGLAVTLTLTAPARADDPVPAKIQTVLELLATPATLDQEHPTATVSGKVTDQATGNPVKDVTVNLYASGGSIDVTAVTNETGDFTATYTVNPEPYIGPSNYAVSAYVFETDQVLASGGKIVYLTVNPTPTTLTLNADHSKADFNQPIGLSGKLTAPGANLSGKTVTITPAPDSQASCNVYDTTSVTVPMKDDGTFTTTVKPRCSVSSYTASVPARGWYKAASAATGGIQIRQPVDIQIYPTITKYGDVGVNGSIAARYAAGNFTGRSIELQFSLGTYAKPSGKWTTKKTLKIQPGNGFSYSFASFNQSGYWRARIAGSSDALPAISPVKRAWRWNSHFVNVKLSTRRTSFLHKLTISGQLIRWIPTNKGNSAKQISFAHQKVQIGFTCNSRKNVWYTDNGWAKTDSHGRFKKTIKGYCTGKMFVVFWGSWDTYSTGSQNIPITVTGSPLHRTMTAFHERPLTGLQPSLNLTRTEPGRLG